MGPAIVLSRQDYTPLILVLLHALRRYQVQLVLVRALYGNLSSSLSSLLQNLYAVPKSYRYCPGVHQIPSIP